MTGTRLYKSSALAALAAATMVAPSIANAQDRDHDRGGGEHRGGGNGGGYNRGQGQQAAPQQQMQRPQQVQQQQQFQAQRQQQFEAQRQQFQAQRQQQMQAQAQAQGQYQGQRGWQGRYQGNAAQQPGGGWQGRYQGQGQQMAPVYQGRNQAYIDAQRNRSYTPERRDFDRRDGDRGQWRGYRGGNQQAWNNGWRRDGRYNWQGYRQEHRDIFRAGRYYAPYNNYYYRPLGIGFTLDQAFFGEDYWIGDPGYYRLPPAYGPYRWVRYYDDVLLVNIYSGEVVDEIRGFFY